MGPKVGLDGCGKSRPPPPHQVSITGPFILQQDATQTELSRLIFFFIQSLKTTYYDIFIHCNWVWVNLYQNGKERNGELIQKHRIHKIETKRTKQENKHKENIKKNLSRLISKLKLEANNTDTMYCTEPT